MSRFRMHPAWILVGMVLTPGCAAFGQTSTSVHGYAKNLAIRSSSPLSGEAFILDVSRFRAKGQVLSGSRFSAEAWLDTEVLLGSFVSSDENKLAETYSRPSLLDLDWEVTAGESYQVRQDLFRVFATVYFGQSHLTIGRQRITWGSGFAWNPTDIINPFNPGAIELGQRAGVDAAYLSVGNTSRLELAVAAAGREWSQTILASRYGTNFREYDVALMAALMEGAWVAGGDFAGYVQGAGLRGELAYTRRAEGRGSIRAVLNADYAFPGGLYSLAEVHYNGPGSRSKADYDVEALLRGDTFSLAQRYAALSVSGAFSPLVGGALYGLANFDDGSALVGPSLTASLADNVDMAASTYFLVGKSDTEYGGQRHIFFASVQWYY